MTAYIDDGDLRLYHGDVLHVLAELPDSSVDCVVTSPPYWGLRDYGTPGQLGLEETPGEYVANIVAVFRQVRRVLAPHGTCWVNLGDSYARDDRDHYPNGGRNARSVWNIATQPYPEAHFATFPEELARRCILAGCPTRVCLMCGKPSERIVETDGSRWNERKENGEVPRHGVSGVKPSYSVGSNPRTYLGWSDCGHNNWRPGLVLDPFAGSGTTLKVARDHQRHSIGIDLSLEYLQLAARRLQQLSLLTGQ